MQMKFNPIKIRFIFVVLILLGATAQAFGEDLRLVFIPDAVTIGPGGERSVMILRTGPRSDPLHFMSDVQRGSPHLVSVVPAGPFARDDDIAWVRVHAGGTEGRTVVAVWAYDPHGREVNARLDVTVQGMRVSGAEDASAAIFFLEDSMLMEPGESRSAVLMRNFREPLDARFKLDVLPHRGIVTVPDGKWFTAGGDASHITLRAASRTEGYAHIIATAMAPGGDMPVAGGRRVTASLYVYVGTDKPPPEERDPNRDPMWDDLPDESLPDTEQPPALPEITGELSDGDHQLQKLLGEAEGYEQAYLDSALELANALPGPTKKPMDAFILPEKSSVLIDARNDREAGYAAAKQRINAQLDEVYRGDDLNALVETQRDLEVRAIDRSFARYFGDMPDTVQQSLISARAFYNQYQDDIKQLLQAYYWYRRLGAFAQAYYTLGPMGLLENGLKLGCDYFFDTTTKAVQGAAFMADYGTVGTYLVAATGWGLRWFVCHQLLPMLFDSEAEEIQPASYDPDPVVDEWVRILYTGEIESGVDRPDLPPDLSFYERHGIHNSRELLHAFGDQERLHEALRSHWTALWNDDRALRTYLNIWDSDTALNIWKRIYAVSAESMVTALRTEVAALPKPQQPRVPELEQYPEDVEETGWLGFPQKPKPRIIRERPREIGTVSFGMEVDVLTRFAVLGIAGIDETITVEWEIPETGFLSSIQDSRKFDFQFPEDRIDPSRDLVKTGVHTFSFKVDEQGFVAGKNYEVIVTFRETGSVLRIPFRVEPGEEQRPGTVDRTPQRPLPEAGEKPVPEAVWLIINVAGSGYTPHWAGGSTFYSGSHDQMFVVRRGQDPMAAIEEYRLALIGDPCEKDIPAIPGLTNRPTFWDSGPQITILDVGPFMNEWDARAYTFRDTWKGSPRDGLHIGKLKAAAGCGG